MSRAKPASAESSPGAVSWGASQPIPNPSTSPSTSVADARIQVKRSDCSVARATGQVPRGGPGHGDGGAADGGVLEGGVDPQGLDEVVDPAVGGVVDLQLVAPRLQ